jgi:hypothetical protein
MAGSDNHDSLTPSERRLGYRYLACFPAYLQHDDGSTRASMIHDLSLTGALLLVRAEMNVGDTVRLKLFIDGDVTRSRDVTARVVRVERLEDTLAGPWSRKIAVQFDDEDLGDVEQQIKDLAKKQADFFRPSE